MDIATIFKVMMKGVMISRNSQKYGEMATFLLDEENYIQYEEVLQTLGYELNGENGYFFLSKSEALNSDEVDQFVRSHKEVFILISILKQLMPYVRSGTTIRYTEFISLHEQKNDEKMNEKWHYLFGESDLKSSSEKFFERLGKEYIIEQIDRKDSDSYLVLNGIDYYLSLLESM